MCGATIQRLNYGKNESKQESIKRNFAVSISDTPMALKQSQGHQIYHENVDLFSSSQWHLVLPVNSSVHPFTLHCGK